MTAPASLSAPLSPRAIDVLERVRAFVDDVVQPLEPELMKHGFVASLPPCAWSCAPRLAFERLYPGTPQMTLRHFS